MKNRIYYTFATASIMLMNAPKAFAQEGRDIGTIKPVFDPTPVGGFAGILQFVINAFFFIAIVAALVYLLWGGLNWILSGGDKEKIESARSRIIAAIVGLVLVVLAYFILDFVLELIGLGGINNLCLPILGDPNGLKCSSGA